MLFRPEEKDPLQIRKPFGAQIALLLGFKLRHRLIYDLNIIRVPKRIDDHQILTRNP